MRGVCVRYVLCASGYVLCGVRCVLCGVQYVPASFGTLSRYNTPVPGALTNFISKNVYLR